MLGFFSLYAVYANNIYVQICDVRPSCERPSASSARLSRITLVCVVGASSAGAAVRGAGTSSPLVAPGGWCHGNAVPRPPPHPVRLW